MNRTRRTFLFVGIAVLVLCGASVQKAFAVDAVTPTVPSTTPQIHVAIPIPGVTDSPCADGSAGYCVDDLGAYIAGFYRYFAGAVGLLATVIVMWGGIKWITASGNASRVSDAKDTIYSALIAILLTLGSYVLLRAINPNLLELTLPSIGDITHIEIGGRCEDLVGYSIAPLLDCGTATATDADGNHTQCLWDTCSGMTQVCTPPADSTQAGPSSYTCLDVLNLCESLDGNNSLPDWCTHVDTLMQQAMNGSLPKFGVRGCGYNRVSGGADQCVLGMLFSTMQNNPIYHGYFASSVIPGGTEVYEPRFYNCFTDDAEGKCWEWHDNDPSSFKVAKDCGGQSICANVGDYPRPVTGADGGCVKKVSNGEYKCWQVPQFQPPGPY